MDTNSSEPLKLSARASDIDRVTQTRQAAIYKLTQRQRDRRRARDARYNRSEKGLARHRRYNVSPKGTARSDAYEQRHFRIPVHDGSIRIPRTPEGAAVYARIMESRAAFCERQLRERTAFERQLSEHQFSEHHLSELSNESLVKMLLGSSFPFKR